MHPGSVYSHFDALTDAVIDRPKFSLGESNYPLRFGAGHLPMKGNFHSRFLQCPSKEWGPRSQPSHLVSPWPDTAPLSHVAIGAWLAACLSLEVEKWVLWKCGYTRELRGKRVFSSPRISQSSLALEMVTKLNVIWKFHFIPLWRSYQWYCLNSEQGDLLAWLLVRRGPGSSDDSRAAGPWASAEGAPGELVSTSRILGQIMADSLCLSLHLEE